MTSADPGNPEPGPDATVDDLHADIEATRHQLGETVEALTAKFDVKAQAKQRVDDTRDRLVDVATDDAGAIRPQLLIAVIALLAAIVGLVIWKSQR